MKRILVPTDFSICAKAAAEAAIAVAKRAKSEIYFLNFCSEMIPSQNKEPETIYAKRELALLVNHAKNLGVMATPVLVVVQENEKIENYVDQYQIHFIVMGSHGAKGIKELFIGSNTQRVIRHVHVPVLVIKKIDKEFEMTNLLFASTFRENVLQSFREVASFATLFNANVHLVSINYVDHLVETSVAERSMNELRASFPTLNFSNNLAETNDEEWAINQFANQLGADAIAISTFDKEGFPKFLSKPIAENLINHQHLPVLVINSK